MIGDKYNNQICWTCEYRWANENAGPGWCYMFKDKHDLLRIAKCGQYRAGNAKAVTGLHLGNKHRGSANG